MTKDLGPREAPSRRTGRVPWGQGRFPPRSFAPQGSAQDDTSGSRLSWMDGPRLPRVMPTHCRAAPSPRPASFIRRFPFGTT